MDIYMTDQNIGKNIFHPTRMCGGSCKRGYKIPVDWDRIPESYHEPDNNPAKDALSKAINTGDWSINLETFKYLKHWLGRFTVDLFASDRNYGIVRRRRRVCA